MNLIEQLGGYENSKRLFHTYDHALMFRYYPNYSENSDNFVDVFVLDLKTALLEYRRQHNIFEVGDKVVEITDYPSNDVLTVKSIFDKLLVCESDDFNASYVLSNKYKPYFYVRHATDAEIEAGKRLEVV
ncbi:hypothetical protein KTJ13_05450 [Acinetobacter radioresistens]|uniref:hypothetical protein n=1 Tax=Acinetobacter radioresistens TaxID=40216 RepID=UPI0021CDDE16|nr:hypothetical protein [Acinetobacter radioresistens]MCU4595313.1 hypothetical protein [Acinetobacter radioresistens]